MSLTSMKEEYEHKIACLEADLEETTDLLQDKINSLEEDVDMWKDTCDKWNEDYHKLLKENEKLKEELKKRANVFVANSADEL